MTGTRILKFVLLGASLALMLQTNYRFAGPIGIGEFFMVVYLLVSMGLQAFSNRPLVINKPDNLTSLYLATIVLVVVPATFLSSAIDKPGSSFRDLSAYLLICAVLLALPKKERDIHIMVVTFLAVLFLTIFVQYFFGGSSAYYSLRFTGGAKNPNQLAIYLVAAFIMSAFLKNMIARVVVCGIAIFFGIASLSDAFLIFAVIFLATFLLLTLVQPRIVLYMSPVLMGVIYIVVFYSGIGEILEKLWSTADEGGSRTQLYVSAIYAWLDTPFSFIFGHGAGSFSGLSGPFEGAEAHNTIFDLATVAGIFGLVLFPLFLVYMVLAYMSKNYRFVPAVLTGLVAFAFFHFVGRQPIFWVSLVLLSLHLNRQDSH